MGRLKPTLQLSTRTELTKLTSNINTAQKLRERILLLEQSRLSMLNNIREEPDEKNNKMSTNTELDGSSTTGVSGVAFLTSKEQKLTNQAKIGANKFLQLKSYSILNAVGLINSKGMV